MARERRRIGINLPSRSPSARSIKTGAPEFFAEAADFAGQLSNLHTANVMEKREREAIAAAEKLTFERDENGNIVAPQTPMSDGFFGPSVFERAFRENALRRYQQEVELTTERRLGEIFNTHAAVPEGVVPDAAAYDEEASTYLDTVLKNVPDDIRGTVGARLEVHKNQYFNRIHGAQTQRINEQNRDVHLLYIEELIKDAAQNRVAAEKDFDSASFFSDDVDRINEEIDAGFTGGHYGVAQADMLRDRAAKSLNNSVLMGLIAGYQWTPGMSPAEVEAAQAMALQDLQNYLDGNGVAYVNDGGQVRMTTASEIAPEVREAQFTTMKELVGKMSSIPKLAYQAQVSMDQEDILAVVTQQNIASANGETGDPVAFESLFQGMRTPEGRSLAARAFESDSTTDRQIEQAEESIQALMSVDWTDEQKEKLNELQQTYTDPRQALHAMNAWIAAWNKDSASRGMSATTIEKLTERANIDAEARQVRKAAEARSKRMKGEPTVLDANAIVATGRSVPPPEPYLEAASRINPEMAGLQAESEYRQNAFVTSTASDRNNLDKEWYQRTEQPWVPSEMDLDQIIFRTAQNMNIPSKADLEWIGRRALDQQADPDDAAKAKAYFAWLDQPSNPTGRAALKDHFGDSYYALHNWFQQQFSFQDEIPSEQLRFALDPTGRDPEAIQRFNQNRMERMTEFQEAVANWWAGSRYANPNRNAIGHALGRIFAPLRFSPTEGTPLLNEEDQYLLANLASTVFANVPAARIDEDLFNDYMEYAVNVVLPAAGIGISVLTVDSAGVVADSGTLVKNPIEQYSQLAKTNPAQFYKGIDEMVRPIYEEARLRAGPNAIGFEIEPEHLRGGVHYRLMWSDNDIHGAPAYEVILTHGSTGLRNTLLRDPASNTPFKIDQSMYLWNDNRADLKSLSQLTDEWARHRNPQRTLMQIPQ